MDLQRVITIVVLLLAAALAAGLLVLVLIRIWQVPPSVLASVAPDTREMLALEYRRTVISAATAVAQVVGGVLLLAGLYFTWRSVATADRTLAVAIEGQVTERFTRAMEQLGAPELSRRLGGIYALERIARNSEPDHWTVMEILAIYAREQSKVSAERHDDVDAVLKVIGRRNTVHELNLHPEAFLDLSEVVSTSGTDLQRSNFTRVRFTKAVLRGVNLQGATLAGCDFSFADLSEANLSSANLTKTLLPSAILRKARLDEANMSGAVLELADLSHASLQRVRGENADFQGGKADRAVFVGAYLRGASFEATQMSGASLTGADLERAKLETALHGVDLRYARLRGASVYASFQNANLHSAKLQGTDLRNATDLTPEQIKSTETDSGTILPPYLQSARPK